MLDNKFIFRSSPWQSEKTEISKPSILRLTFKPCIIFMAILYILLWLFGTENHIWWTASLPRKDPSCFGYHFYSRSRATSANADNQPVAEALTAAAASRAGEGSVRTPEMVDRWGLWKGCFFWYSVPFYMFRHCFYFFNHSLMSRASEMRLISPSQLAFSIFKTAFIDLKAPGHCYCTHPSALLICCL